MSDNPEMIIENKNDHHEHRHQKKKAKKTYSLADDMLLAFLITFAAGASSYGGDLYGSISSLYNWLILVAFTVIWFGLSLYSGLKSKWKFAIFTVLFWLVPIIGISLYESGPEVFGMSVIMYVLSEFFRLLAIDSTSSVLALIGLDGITGAVIFLLLNMLIFFAGIVFVLMHKQDDAEEDYD